MDASRVIIEPPSVAAAIEAIVDECAVWYDSMDSIESLGSMAPWAAGGSSSRFGEGRMVRMEESEGGTVVVACGECERMTVVL